MFFFVCLSVRVHRCAYTAVYTENLHTHICILTIIYSPFIELPTGLYLLRRISRPYLASKFPEIKYSSFVCSCILRITMGYLFLINVIIILAQASGVVDIFYDVLGKFYILLFYVHMMCTYFRLRLTHFSFLSPSHDFG